MTLLPLVKILNLFASFLILAVTLLFIFLCNFGGRIMSGYEVIKAQLQMPPPPPHRWHEAKKKLA